jgi:hypothetical protein
MKTYTSTFSWPRHYFVLSGQLHTPSSFTPGERDPCTHWKEGWVGLRTSPDYMQRKFLTLHGLEIRTLVIQPIASHYTDWYINTYILVGILSLMFQLFLHPFPTPGLNASLWINFLAASPWEKSWQCPLFQKKIPVSLLWRWQCSGSRDNLFCMRARPHTHRHSHNLISNIRQLGTCQMFGWLPQTRNNSRMIEGRGLPSQLFCWKAF